MSAFNYLMLFYTQNGCSEKEKSTQLLISCEKKPDIY